MNYWAEENKKLQKSTKIRSLSFSTRKDESFRIRILPCEPPFYAYMNHWLSAWDVHSHRSRFTTLSHSPDKFCPICASTTDHKIQSRINYDMIAVYDGQIRRIVCTPTIWRPIFKAAKKFGPPSDFKTGYDFIVEATGQGLNRRYKVTPQETSEIIRIECGDINIRKLRFFATSQEIKNAVKISTLPQHLIRKILDTSTTKLLTSKNKYRFIQRRINFFEQNPSHQKP